MPLDRGIIDQQLQEIGEGTRWWDVRELRDLPAILHSTERILAVSRGRIARVLWLRRRWLILVTDERVLCVRSGRTSSWRQVEIPAGEISRVTLRVGPLRGRVLLGADRKYRLVVPRKDANKLFSALSVLDSPANRAIGGFAPGRAVRKVVDHLMALPAVALDPEPRPSLPRSPDEPSPVVGRLESLEEQMSALQEQVDFLQQLIDQRRAGPSSTEDDVAE